MDPHGEILPRLQGEACGAGSQREGLEGCGSKNKGEEAGRHQDKGKKDAIHELSSNTRICQQSCSGPSWQAAPSLAASSLPGSAPWGREHSRLQCSPEAGYLCGFLMKGARTPWLLPRGCFFISQGCFFISQGLPSGHEDSWVSLAMVSQGSLAEGFASHPLYAPDLSLQTLMETSSYKSVSKLMGALAQSLKPSDEEQVSLGPSRPLFES